MTKKSSVGKRIRFARSRRRLTQLEVSQKTGIAQEVISRIEGGYIEPQIKTLKRIAAALRVKVGYLLGLR